MHAHIIVEGRVERTESVEVIRAAHAAARSMWVELGEATPEAEALLTGTFGVHPLVVEDIFGERSVPKIEELDGYLYVVVHALTSGDPQRTDLGVLDIVIGHTFVLTQHREGPATERLRARLEASPELLQKGAAWVAHAFIDMIIDRFLPFMEALRGRVDTAEMRVMTADATNERDLLPELFALKRSVQALHRIAHHQRDILRQLSRAEYPQIPRTARPYFRDVYDHFTRVAEDAETYKDLVGGAIDAYLNVQSYRMNDTVKRLTLISTVMLPLNLIAGFYGMNFSTLPGLGWRWGFLCVLGVMVAVSVGVWTYFKYRRWT